MSGMVRVLVGGLCYSCMGQILKLKLVRVKEKEGDASILFLAIGIVSSSSQLVLRNCV